MDNQPVTLKQCEAMLIRQMARLGAAYDHLNEVDRILLGAPIPDVRSIEASGEIAKALEATRKALTLVYKMVEEIN